MCKLDHKFVGYSHSSSLFLVPYVATSRKVAGSIPDGVIEIFH